jgi:chromate transporter
MKSEDASPAVSLSEAFRYWFKLGFINFGGPAGQIAMMHKDVVEKRGWIDEKMFLRALNFCMLLPGPEAHQLAVYIGWRLNGYRGGAIAGLCFLFPSMLLMLLLSWLAASKGQVSLVAGIFHGISAAVVAIVVEALARLSKKALKHNALYWFAAGAFIAGQFFGLPFPVIVLLAGLAGVLLARSRPDIFCHRVAGAKECALEEPRAAVNVPSLGHLFKVTALFAGVWAAVAAPLALWRGLDDTLTQVMLFFTKAAFVTFGGAYAVLAYIADNAVRLGWLTEQHMLLGLGLAETTPGPLIMVTQFVGFFAAWSLPGDLGQLQAGVLGALLTTFATFLPSFMFIFAGAPYIKAITSNQKFAAALTGISAAVVGVVLKLGVFFAVNTFFPGKSIDLFAIVVACASLYALLKLKMSMHALVGLSGVVGLAWRLLS